MKNLTFLIVVSLLLTGCSKILGTSGSYTFEGTLYKDCNKTPIANAKIVYTTFRGGGLGGPLTRSSETQTDANGRFSFKEASSDLNSITLELALPPKYEAGPVIAKLELGGISNDQTKDLGQLFYAKRGVDVGGDADYGAKLRIKIDPYFQQFDSLIVGKSNWPLILSPVPSSYEYSFNEAGAEDFVYQNATIRGAITWCSSLIEYKKRYSPPIGAPIFKRNIDFTLCNQGQAIEFSIDTFSKAKP